MSLSFLRVSTNATAPSFLKPEWETLQDHMEELTGFGDCGTIWIIYGLEDSLGHWFSESSPALVFPNHLRELLQLLL
jgi:hypothetical protein